MANELKKTPLFQLHKELGAHLSEFAGFLLPIYYSSIREEHLAVRQNVGLFDVTHMGRIQLLGPRAKECADFILTNNIKSTQYGDVKYTVMCNENGGIIDDILSYTFSDQKILLVVNACNIDKDYKWIHQHLWDGLEIRDLSQEVAQFAVQGPLAESLLQNFTSFDLSILGYYKFAEIEMFGKPLMISRTGYTGEDGFELYFPVEYGEEVFHRLLKKGKEYGLLPCGLGARDTLRLEVCYWLYGNEIDESVNPIESGQKFVVDFEKERFIGKEALVKIANEGIKRRWRGIEISRGIARHGYKIFSDSKEIGVVTSGGFSFTLNKSLALGYINLPFGEIGEEVIIAHKGRTLKGKIVRRPFLKPRTKKQD